MNHVILLPSGEGIRNQLISVIDFLFFFLFFLMFLKISLCLASICGMKSVITVLKAAVWDLGFAAAFPAMWEALPGADCQSGASVG